MKFDFKKIRNSDPPRVWWNYDSRFTKIRFFFLQCFRSGSVCPFFKYHKNAFDIWSNSVLFVLARRSALAPCGSFSLAHIPDVSVP